MTKMLEPEVGPTLEDHDSCWELAHRVDSFPHLVRQLRFLYTCSSLRTKPWGFSPFSFLPSLSYALCNHQISDQVNLHRPFAPLSPFNTDARDPLSLQVPIKFPLEIRKSLGQNSIFFLRPFSFSTQFIFPFLPSLAYKNYTACTICLLFLEFTDIAEQKERLCAVYGGVSVQSRVELLSLLVVGLGLGLVCIVGRNQGKEGMEGRRQGRCAPAIGCGGGRRFTGGRTCITTPTSFAPGKGRARARPGPPRLRSPRCCACARPTTM